MALYKLQSDYFNLLSDDKEFEKDTQRLYYTIRKLKYKGNSITVAIPLRSNINFNFQRNKDEYIATPPSDKTLTQRGNIAGWHIAKMIPFDYSLSISAKKLKPGLQIAADIAGKYNNDELIKKSQIFLDRLTNGEKPFGAIDFDSAVNKMNNVIAEKACRATPAYHEIVEKYGAKEAERLLAETLKPKPNKIDTKEKLMYKPKNNNKTK